MNTHSEPSRVASRGASLAVFAGCVLLVSRPVAAQSSALPKADEPVQLSPFSVTVDADQGYNPTETLSGTRLRSSTKDTASALTILTPQLLNDLGIVNAEEALSFVANTEPYGITDDDTASFQGRVMTKPFRTRGLTSSSYSSGFFDTIAPIDRFNTGSFSFMRGPNSILFGTGAAGGMLDAQPKRATFKSVTSLDSRFDSLGSWRVASELNRELVKNKVAVQLDLLSDERYSYRKPATEDRKSAFGTVGWKVSSATTVTANAEMGRINKVVPWPMMFFDYYTTWVNAGSKTLAAGEAPGAATGTRTVSAGTNAYYVSIANPDATSVPVMNWRGAGQGDFPTLGGAVRNNVPFASEALSPIPRSTAIEGPGNRRDSHYRTFQAILEHRFSNDFYVEAAWNRMTSHFSDLTTIRANALGIYVDPNRTQPNGQPNPNVGLPYVETNPFQFLQTGTFDENQGRISAAYYKDLEKHRLFGDVGLGRYQFGAFLTGTETDEYADTYQEVVNVNSFVTGKANNAQNFLHRRYYLKPGGQSYLTDQLPHLLQNAGTAVVPAVNTGFLQTSQGSRVTRVRIYGISLVGQASWWRDRIVYTAGIRKDRTINTRAQMPIGPDGTYLPFDDATALWSTLTYQGQTTSNGLTLHVTKEVSLFASRSGNFVPPSINRYTFIDTVPPPIEGRGSETGVRFDLFDGRLTGTVSYYDTEERNRADSVISANKQIWVQYLWDAIKGPGYYIAPANPFADTLDRKSTGYELQLTASPIPSIRVYGNVSKTKVVASNVDPYFTGYFNANVATWAANRSRTVDDFRNFGFKTVGDTLDRLSQEFAGNLAVTGQRPVNTREWLGSLAVTYIVPKKIVNGLRLTGRASWLGQPVIGYLTNSSAILGHSEATYDLSASYERRLKLGQRTIAARATLQFLNVTDAQKPVPLSAVALGAGPNDYYVSNQRLPAPRIVQFSMGFDF